MGVWLSGWMDGQTDTWIVGWMEGQVDGYMGVDIMHATSNVLHKHDSPRHFLVRTARPNSVCTE